MAKGTRLDTALVDRGLAPSRERARALILAGQVTIDGQIVSKAGAAVTAAAKPTYPALFGLQRSRDLAAECLARAHRGLQEGGLTDGWLGPIADYVVSRKS